MCLVHYLLTKEDAFAGLLNDMSRLLNRRYSTYIVYIVYILSHISQYIEIYIHICTHKYIYYINI